MSARLLTLDVLDASDAAVAERVGGKAAGLARLRALGLRVPDAFVLVGAGGAAGVPLDEIRERFGDASLAVRSSAIGEDGDSASFAGQYDTVLEVRGEAALRQAIERCLRSAKSARAESYRSERDSEAGAGDAVMSVVIQRMVDARASGVCFTADPVTHRRNRLVIDAVSGLGEKLVSGHASPDHYELRRDAQRWEAPQLAGEVRVLSDAECEMIAREAIEAEARVGEVLDLEWAIDAAGEVQWLQARPITTLSVDPQVLDTPVYDAADVYTRCNVGEMMPGAVSPLTYSTCARGIDVGWQQNLVAIGVHPDRDSQRPYLGMTHGHLFINLSEGARFSAAVTGASPDQQSLAICGRLVPGVVEPPVPPLRVRLPRILRQVWSTLRAQPRLRRMERLAAHVIPDGPSALEQWRNIDAELEALFESYALHLTVSSGAGALAPIMLRILAGDDEPSDAHHAAVAHVLAGARDVESADIAQGAEAVLEALAVHRDAQKNFAEVDAASARAWLSSDAAGAAGRSFAAYLERHGHRSVRELDVRQPEWAEDPDPLVRSLQAQLRSRLSEAPRESSRGDGDRRPADASLDAPPDAARLRWLARPAHAAVRNRERGKSLLVAHTARFKRAYRRLGAQLVAEHKLPDADALYFLLHEELGELAQADAETAARLAAEASGRREAFAYQETLHFPEVSVGLPEPEERAASGASSEGLIVGKPVSRGCVEGRVRIVHSLAEAEALEVGEILVAPITDVGWTPYFAIIAGLVTDVGSAVSHGAVVAREFGLPAVLNTGVGTVALQTGDRVRLDGDRGSVEVLERAPARGGEPQ